MNSKNFSQSVISWYHKHGRKDLPWQINRTAYSVWLSEIMLQQTQVVTVIPYFERFIQQFSSFNDLANAAEDDVLHLWSGLGYYARARNLHKTAKIILQDYAGEFPENFEQANALPGIGRSTAGAVLAQAFGLRHAILDGNVKRVLARYHAIEGWTGLAKIQHKLWQFAEHHTPDHELADYTQAMMDIGATLCTRKQPHCDVCPLASDCLALEKDCVDKLPTPKPRKKIPVKAARLLVMLNENNQVLLEKRPPTGIWGGLWSLPEIEMDISVEDYCQQQWQFKVKHIEDAESFRHTFSHYHFDITPCRVVVNNLDQCVMEDDRIVWYNTFQTERLGLAAPVKTILNSLNEV
jgi:A/G-specific adenine glycosylase